MGFAEEGRSIQTFSKICAKNKSDVFAILLGFNRFSELEGQNGRSLMKTLGRVIESKTVFTRLTRAETLLTAQ